MREDPGLVGLCDDDDSCLKNSLGFMVRWDTNAAASCRSSNVHRVQEIEMIKEKPSILMARSLTKFIFKAILSHVRRVSL